MATQGTLDDVPIEFFDNISKSHSTDVFRKALDTSISAARSFGASRILISSEVLTNQPLVSWIHQVLAEAFSEVRVIYYIRRQDDFLLSAWQQWSHKAGVRLSDCIEDSLRVKAPNYLHITDVFVRNYGLDSVAVRPIAPCALIEGSLLKDFCSRSNIKLPDDAFLAGRANVGINECLCDVLSRINSIYKNVHDDEVKTKLLSLASNPELVAKRCGACLSNVARRKIMKAFRKDNKILRKRFFPDVKIDDVFGVDSKDISEAMQLRAELDGLKDVLAVIFDLVWRLILEKSEGEKMPCRVDERI